MTAIVIDASSLGPFLIPDEANDAFPDLLDLIAAQGGIAPQHWRLEIANLMRMAVRRRRLQPEQIPGLVQMLQDLHIAIDDQTQHAAWHRSLTISTQYDLTVYDAAYLELAQRNGCALATLDQALAKAARAENVELLSG